VVGTAKVHHSAAGGEEKGGLTGTGGIVLAKRGGVVGGNVKKGKNGGAGQVVGEGDREFLEGRGRARGGGGGGKTGQEG
jgi:hypothetical protein